ncbi:hypothetical protein [Lignipirellula cremea]|uniref:Glycosyltransferase RgtA/B/C/D-like domain-containing protein n=1 Tax=Lignipirellula cremea TaxID=2528010 RepID=A0A518E054_9BACT|nr:hypothetical protein [Lignipirellula cremea]QDU97465.1 hypothetical protein Pla8534_53130 [Lignipirellula cremea]
MTKDPANSAVRESSPGPLAWLAAPRTLFLLMLAAAGVMRTPGPDFLTYADWSAAVYEGNIDRVFSHQHVSVLGLPFNQWLAGPGLLIAPLNVLFEEKQAAYIAGFLCAAVFWRLFYQGMRELTDVGGAWLACGTAFVATPLGYYSTAISSETFSLLPAGVLFQQTILLARTGRASTPLVACATGVLLMIRPYLGVFAWPVLLPLCYLACRRGWRPGGICVTLCGGAIGLASMQIGVVNYWMTGDPLRSPYRFGDDGFQSLDRSSPFLGNVLFDTFHGLLPTHPLVGFGALLLPVLLVRAWRQGENREAAVWALAIVATAVNAYIQGCWYYWWLAVGPTFGMRGLLLVSLPAMAGVMRAWALLADRPRSRAVLTAVMLLGTLWSWLLLTQGPMDYLSWTYLLEGQLLELRFWGQLPQLLILLGSAALCGLMLVPAWPGTTRRGLFGAWFTMTLAVASLCQLQESRHPEATTIAGAAAVALAVSWLLSRTRMAGGRLARLQPLAERSVCVLFVLMLAGFVRLVPPTQAKIAPVPAEQAAFFYDYEVQGALQTLRGVEQRQVVRFAALRQSIAAFLVRSGKGEQEPPPLATDYLDDRSQRPASWRLFPPFSDNPGPESNPHQEETEDQG